MTLSMELIHDRATAGRITRVWRNRETGHYITHVEDMDSGALLSVSTSMIEPDIERDFP